MEYTLILTSDEINKIGIALQNGPWIEVNSLILKIQNQIKEQEAAEKK